MERTARKRVVVARVTPEIECGRFPIKRVEGESVTVEAEVFCDGHDRLQVRLLHRAAGTKRWTAVPMEPLPVDRWRGSFTVGGLGGHTYTVQAWIDRFGTWRANLEKRIAAEQDIGIELVAGAELIESLAPRAAARDRPRLLAAAESIRNGDVGPALDDWIASVTAQIKDRISLVEHERELDIVVDRARGRFSSWYELFPRSVGTLRDVIDHLGYVEQLGFDVLYLPPVHPIGTTNRKGHNNVPGIPGPGSPWAIGSEDGGHEAIHPELGTEEDFLDLV
ncbi:MAG: maltotransferase domain-containing protein, partial [Actinomycetota bacterium]